MSFYIDPTEMSFDEALLQMTILKNYYQDYENPEEERDQSRIMFHNIAMFFSNEIQDEIQSAVNLNPRFFNLMAPIGGPWAISKDSKITIKPFTANTYEAIIDSNYVGWLHLLENKCGFDNLCKLLGGKNERTNYLST